MLFNSFEYLFIFLPLTLFLAKFFFKLRIYILITSSLFFYAFWSVKYVFLIVFLAIFNFYSGQKIIKVENLEKKKILIFSIILNVLTLITFKYLDFVIFNFNTVFSSEIKYLNIIYPLAISFITFQQIIFLVDCYDGNIKINDKEKKGLNFSNYFLFIIFFPQLIAGPITKFNNIISQYDNIKKVNYDTISRAIFLIIIGLFKKCFIADNLASDVNYYFLNYESLNFAEAWFGSICFTLQFYFDFSAYSDLALGSALLFGISLPKNFNSPLKANSIIEFWQRWHMTLTSFLTNYVYFTLVRKLKEISFFKIMLITLFTFIIAGIWHGPAWTFLIFGFWHGLMLIINHTFRLTKIKINKYFAWILTFICINIGFVFFRSVNVDASLVYLTKMFNINSFSILNLNSQNLISLLQNMSITKILIFMVALIVIFLRKNSNNYVENFKPKLKYLLAMGLIFSLSLISFNSTTEFIYFKY